MKLLDRQFLDTPWYGSRQMARCLRRQGYTVGRKRVRRLMAKMGLAAIYQAPRTTVPHPEHKTYKYLLRDVGIDRPNQVWCADITYVPMRRGFLYLVAVMDWATRKVLSWRLSNTMEADFCIEALEEALATYGAPAMLASTTPPSAQHRPGQPVHLAALRRGDPGRRRPGLHGRARPVDGQRVGFAALRVIERLWRSLKYECVYLHAFETGSELRAGLSRWIGYYNAERPHSALGGRTPDEAYEPATNVTRLAA